MKSWKELAGAVALLACLGGCGPEHGRVTNKEYHEAYTWLMCQPMGNNACGYFLPVEEPEHYELEIVDEKGDEGSIYVDPATYERTQIGDRV